MYLIANINKNTFNFVFIFAKNIKFTYRFMHYFENRTLIIATNHKKEIVISPILEKSLNVKCIVSNLINTDDFGTFSGEIERKNDPITTLRLKCRAALEKSDVDLVLASEGSFGAHPYLFFAQADDELILLYDRKNNLEFIARALSTETNFDGKTINSEVELMEFASKVLFPSHGLILRKDKSSNEEIHKGITNEDELISIYNSLKTKYGTVHVETDMRAMFNPTRMKVIEEATQNLVKKLISLCPNCGIPGFDVTNSTNGLPCENCGNPTDSILSLVYSCQKCNHTESIIYPNKKEFESPMYCNFCNP